MAEGVSNVKGHGQRAFAAGVAVAAEVSPAARMHKRRGCTLLVAVASALVHWRI